MAEFGAANELTFGAERQLSTIATDSLPDFGTGPTTGRDRITGYYAEWQSTLARQLTLTGGVRYDDDHKFGSHTTLKVAGAWQLLDGATILRANYGGGFKAPTLYQLFSPYSNPTQTLKAETSDGWEVGADQLLLDKRLRASLTYFRRHEQNAVDFNDCFPHCRRQLCRAPVRLLLQRRSVALERLRGRDRGSPERYAQRLGQLHQYALDRLEPRAWNWRAGRISRPMPA